MPSPPKAGSTASTRPIASSSDYQDGDSRGGHLRLFRLSIVFYRTRSRPVVVSTLGSYLSEEAVGIFKSTGAWNTLSLPMTGTRPVRRPSLEIAAKLGWNGLLPWWNASGTGPGRKAERCDRLHQRIFTQAPDGFSKEKSTEDRQADQRVFHFLRSAWSTECGFQSGRSVRLLSGLARGG